MVEVFFGEGGEHSFSGEGGAIGEPEMRGEGGVLVEDNVLIGEGGACRRGGNPGGGVISSFLSGETSSSSGVPFAKLFKR
jgi:hypothetical protein